ncbi:hypothetical protein EDD16DRAFT_1595711 [Pisolithus croceorrhizus]|nr:hypothetical protein EDD16DRAFT_1595711 [Pisolithus croceorrhizus]KAI6135607.1 hypothetical protein EV401DRAFT_1897160 [Pisolithus croceorrhizus]KAI6156115.1 hypothetical protein EDD17DRAFT_1628454 [Pisolithus thermaeus]
MNPRRKQTLLSLFELLFEVNLDGGPDTGLSFWAVLIQIIRYIVQCLDDLDAKSNVFLPSNSANGKVPVLIYLGGLTCMEDNVYAPVRPSEYLSLLLGVHTCLCAFRCALGYQSFQQVSLWRC